MLYNVKRRLRDRQIMGFKDGILTITAWLLKSEDGGSHSCHNTWRIGRWWFTVLPCEWRCNGHFEEKKSCRIQLQFDRKMLHRLWDNISESFQSFGRHFQFHLDWKEKDRHDKNKKIKTKTGQQTQNLVPCSHKTPASRAEVEVRMPLPHAAEETCGMSMRDIHARDF